MKYKILCFNHEMFYTVRLILFSSLIYVILMFVCEIYIHFGKSKTKIVIAEQVKIL